MKQSRLEERVREIWEEQGFEVSEVEKGFDVTREDESFGVQVFSSENYSSEDVMEKADAEIVFVDELLSEVAGKIESEVSVLKEQEDRDYELPSFEIIGDVAVINELVDISRETAVENILESHPNVETVLLKTGSLSGEFRVGDYEKLHGEETETVHKEFGCRFRVDPTKVYFSERFSTERKRVVDQIEDGEKVLVMFAGVGPFAVLAAKHANPEKVTAVEKNPEAADYMKGNAELNSVEDVVDPYEGDVREIVPKLNTEFDRIIMPLPESALEFLELATEAAAPGAVIHLYAFSDDAEKLGNEIDEKLPSNFEIRDVVSCGERGPVSERFCVEIVKGK